MNIILYAQVFAHTYIDMYVIYLGVVYIFGVSISAKL